MCRFINGPLNEMTSTKPADVEVICYVHHGKRYTYVRNEQGDYIEKDPPKGGPCVTQPTEEVKHQH